MKYKMVVTCEECAKRKSNGRCPILKRKTRDNGFCAWGREKKGNGYG